jgi:hypothetical protein
MTILPQNEEFGHTHSAISYSRILCVMNSKMWLRLFCYFWFHMKVINCFQKSVIFVQKWLFCPKMKNLDIQCYFLFKLTLYDGFQNVAMFVSLFLVSYERY